jgi:predicted nucleic acid-binding protein
MNPSGVLLDTGPLVALLSKNDANHDRARQMFAECAPPFSLADACLIRSAEIHQEARIATFDTDFGVYKWARNRRFELL